MATKTGGQSPFKKRALTPVFQGFFPIYVNQYAVGHTSHAQPVFADHGDTFSVTVSVTVLGTAPSTVTHKITSNLKEQPNAEQVVGFDAE